jgi:hypothetical protein
MNYYVLELKKGCNTRRCFRHSGPFTANTFVPQYRLGTFDLRNISEEIYLLITYQCGLIHVVLDPPPEVWRMTSMEFVYRKTSPQTLGSSEMTSLLGLLYTVRSLCLSMYIVLVINPHILVNR